MVPSEGEHELDVFAGDDDGFEHVVTWTIIALPSCFAKGKGTFPTKFGMFDQVEMFLCEPMTGTLNAGPTKFQVRANPEKIQQLLVKCGSTTSEMKCTNGLYELEFNAEAPQVAIVGTLAGKVSADLITCLKWKVC